MIKVNYASGRVIAGDSVDLFNAADNALLSSARMTVTLLEAAVESRLDPRTKQKLLEAMNDGQTKLVEGRKNFTSVHSQLVVLQRKTNLAEVDWSCSGLPADMKPSASLTSSDKVKAQQLSSVPASTISIE